MRLIVWLLRAALFFTLFALALNNQHLVTVHWFFGYEWRSPLIFVMLACFALGCAVGVVALTPSWWRHRRHALRLQARKDTEEAAQAGKSGTANDHTAQMPDIHGI